VCSFVCSATANFSYTIHSVVYLNPTRWKAISHSSMRSTMLCGLCERSTYRYANQQTNCFFIEMIRNRSPQRTMAMNQTADQISSSSLWTLQRMPLHAATISVGLIMPSRQLPCCPIMVSHGRILYAWWNSNGTRRGCQHLMRSTLSNLQNRFLLNPHGAPNMRTCPHSRRAHSLQWRRCQNR
jgi:hypothetical protein